jgi:hypothetical protein
LGCRTDAVALGRWSAFSPGFGCVAFTRCAAAVESQFAKDPAKAIENKGKDKARDVGRGGHARVPERDTPQPIKYLPVAPPSRPGEINEAKIGFRALMNKAEKSEDMDKSRAYRLVAFQHSSSQSVPIEPRARTGTSGVGAGSG